MENETTSEVPTPAPVAPGETEFREIGSDAQLTSLYVALGMARAEFGVVEKNRISGKGTNKEFAYADLDASLSATVEALSRNGLVVLQPLTMRGGLATLRTILAHREGGRLVAMFDVPLPDDGDVQTFGKNVTYSRKYQFNALVCIAADQDLDDAGDSQQSFRKQAPKQEEPRRAPQTPQTQAKPANAQGQSAPKAAGSSAAASTSAPSGLASASGSAASPASSAPNGEPPKSQGASGASTSGSTPGAASQTTPTSSASEERSSATKSSAVSTPAAAPAEGTPLTPEQRAHIYVLLGKLGIAGPRQVAHLQSVMGRLGIAGPKVMGETYQRVVDALTAEAGG